MQNISGAAPNFSRRNVQKAEHFREGAKYYRIFRPIFCAEMYQKRRILGIGRQKITENSRAGGEGKFSRREGAKKGAF